MRGGQPRTIQADVGDGHRLPRRAPQKRRALTERDLPIVKLRLLVKSPLVHRPSVLDLTIP
jgi:hypothetical protein